MKPHTLIFFDIDGTLIDLHQKPTIDTLPDIITRLTGSGYGFGLNSNRAHEDVLSIIDTFALAGPFILENGAYIIHPDGSEEVLVGDLGNVQPMLLEALSHIGTVGGHSFTATLSDTTRLYTKEQTVTEDLAVYVNKFRKYSGSIHHRLNGRSHFHLAEELALKLQDYFDTNNISLKAVSHQHGDSITIEVPGITKGDATKHLRSGYQDSAIYAIGDGSNDLAMRPYVDGLFAVSNAITELKEVADYVSEYPITEGVADILTFIEKKRADEVGS